MRLDRLVDQPHEGDNLKCACAVGVLLLIRDEADAILSKAVPPNAEELKVRWIDRLLPNDDWSLRDFNNNDKSYWDFVTEISDHSDDTFDEVVAFVEEEVMEANVAGT